MSSTEKPNSSTQTPLPMPHEITATQQTPTHTHSPEQESVLFLEDLESDVHQPVFQSWFQSLHTSTQQMIMGASVGLLLLGLGFGLGLWLGPDLLASRTQVHMQQLETQLTQEKEKVADLKRTLQHQQSLQEQPVKQGQLPDAVREQHAREGRRYVAALRKSNAQAAATLMDWFVRRWTEILDQPQPDDRVTRRASTLSLLVGGMAENLNPGDYVPWQAEFFNNRWLAELHYDLDKDGLPGSRSAPNAKDAFANESVCHIAMALNQAVVDAQILVMPEMRCDAPNARMSVFLQGATWNDAINEFVQAVKQHGFVVVEREDKGIRLILIGAPKKSNE